MEGGEERREELLRRAEENKENETTGEGKAGRPASLSHSFTGRRERVRLAAVSRSRTC